MSAARPALVGRTRACPHCKATILESASVCPACRHHVRFDPAGTQRQLPVESALRIDGTIRRDASATGCEYCVVIAIRNGRGEEIERRVIGVGALQPGDLRTFSLSVDLIGR